MRRALFLGWMVLGGACTNPVVPRTDEDLAAPAPPMEADLRPPLGPKDLSGGEDLLAQADLWLPPADIAGYPIGPYGSDVGQTIAPLRWEGYVNPTAVGLASTKPYGAFAMNDLRLSGAKYALVYAADYF